MFGFSVLENATMHLGTLVDNKLLSYIRQVSHSDLQKHTKSFADFNSNGSPKG